jgi:hypothetical protein
MTNILIPRVLEHIDCERWGRAPELLAILNVDPTWRHLTERELRQLGRTAGGTRYDQKLLRRLADEDRVLRRIPPSGARPAFWAINEHVHEWRHVPWITSRRRLARFLRTGVFEPSGDLFEHFAGQRPDLFEPQPPKPPTPETAASTDDVRTPPHEVRTNPQPAPTDQGVSEEHVRTNPQADAASLHAFSRSSSKNSSSSGNDDDESAQQAVDGKLRRSLVALGWPLIGEPERLADQLERDHPHRVAEFLAVARANVGKIKAPPLIVATLVAYASAPPAPSLYRPFAPAEAPPEPPAAPPAGFRPPWAARGTRSDTDPDVRPRVS